ncbi:MAG: DUF222 domain-containing protein [Actinomycetota bacterium]
MPQPRQGLSWSWDLDLNELCAILGAPSADGVTDDEDDWEAIHDAAAGAPALSPEELAGRVAEHLTPGPGLAGWLGTAQPADVQDHDLTGVLASWRRLTSWAQAGELAVAAQIASRAARDDEKVAVAKDGRPAQIPEHAAAEVSLALSMTQCSASWWTDLGVTLAWRLAATGAALRAGELDLQRARLIAEATNLLDDVTAQAVEARVLSAAGSLTTGQLRAALRRAVIAADPEGAARRQKEAERRAKISLYADEEGTATLIGQNLPGTHAAAAMARISALARAMKASGAGGGIDLLRAQVFIGLLLGTLPFIPPAQDGPPGQDGPPDRDCPPDPGAAPPRDEESSPPDRDGPPGESGPGDTDDPLPEDGPLPDDGQSPEDGLPPEDRPPDEDDPPEDREEPVDSDAGHDAGLDSSAEAWSSRDFSPGLHYDSGARRRYDEWLDHLPAPAWPKLPAFLAPAPPSLGHISPTSGGLLDLSLSWRTLAGYSAQPGQLGRLGPIGPADARRLAAVACADPSVEWRVILTSPEGVGLAVARIPRRRTKPPDGQTDASGSQSARCDPPAGSVGLVSRVTLTVPRDLLARPPAGGADADPAELPVYGPILAAALRAARRSAARAEAMAAASVAAGGCAHTGTSAAYRPPRWLKELIAARDITCRFLTCRQPAWRGDLDHTLPYDSGGPTCWCNLGGLCRCHHRLKQHARWRLVQEAPGRFIWKTATGRSYTVSPDVHPV